MAQCAFADDWCGAFTYVDELKAAWQLFSMWSVIMGQKLGVKRLSKTVVTGVRYVNGKPTDVADPKLHMADGTMVPFMASHELYKHLGVWQRASGGAGALVHKVRGKVQYAMGRLQRMGRVSRREFCLVAEVLMRGIVGFYFQTEHLTWAEAEQMESLFRKAYNKKFRRPTSSARISFYAPRSWGRDGERGGALRTHAWGIALAAVYTVVHECVSEPVDSPQRAAMRSAVALALTRWGCRTAPELWNWRHLRKALERQLAGGRVRHIGDTWMLAALVAEGEEGGATLLWRWLLHPEPGDPLWAGAAHFETPQSEMVFEGSGLGVEPAEALLEAGIVALEHFSALGEDGQARWIESFKAALDLYPQLAESASAQRQWEATMLSLQAAEAGGRAVPGVPAEAASLGAGYVSKEEARQGTQRTRELRRGTAAQERLLADLVARRDAVSAARGSPEEAGAPDADAATMGLEAGPSTSQWESRLRATLGLQGAGRRTDAPRLTGVVDSGARAVGPRIMWDTQRRMEDFGGEDRWMRRRDVGESGWLQGWEERAEAAIQGLHIDDGGFVAWVHSGRRLTLEEAAARGPAVEMATRARIELGENIEVEKGEPCKRIGKGGRGGGQERGQRQKGAKPATNDSGTGVQPEKCPVCTLRNDAPMKSCEGCERRVHAGCCEERGDFCLECCGVEGDELFQWQMQCLRDHQRDGSRSEVPHPLPQSKAPHAAASSSRRESSSPLSSPLPPPSISSPFQTPPPSPSSRRSPCSSHPTPPSSLVPPPSPSEAPDGGDSADSEEGNAPFVNVTAAWRSLVTMVEWWARTDAEAVFTLDGSRAELVVQGAGGQDERRTVAAWAACRHDGEVTRGALPDGVKDNYMAEMAAQLAVARARGVQRVVVVFDATSPPEVLRRFIHSCWRRQQRIYRRDWLDSWAQDLQQFETVVFVWQTSHVGAPVNEFADVEAGKAVRAGLTEERPDLRPARYASLELTRAGEIVSGGVRTVVAAAAQEEAVRRLQTTCGSAQTLAQGDLELAVMPDRLDRQAENVMCGRCQLGDPRRYHSQVARQMAKEHGCPFGCGCKFTWHDVAFTCGGAPIVRARAAWRAKVEHAKVALERGSQHWAWAKLLRRLEAAAQPGGVGRPSELRHGEEAEVQMRRLVGGAVASQGEDGAGVKKRVTLAVRAGLELQEEASKAAADFEGNVRLEVQRCAQVRPLAARWLHAVLHGGPRRAARLREAACARQEAEDALGEIEDGTAAEELARVDMSNEEFGVELLKQWQVLGEVAAEEQEAARETRAMSKASAMREWRWLAMLRRWRWRAAAATVGLGGDVQLPKCAVRDSVLEAVLGRTGDATWKHVCGPDSLLAASIRARRAWSRAGGRRVLAWLRRWDVHAGLEADSYGRWRVERIVQVQRPDTRRGRQLDVLVEWRGADALTGQAWGCGWVAVTWLTEDLKAEARQMEASAYPAPPEPEAGWRRSPRIAVADAGDSGGDECAGDCETDTNDGHSGDCSSDGGQEDGLEDTAEEMEEDRAAARDAVTRTGLQATTWAAICAHGKGRADAEKAAAAAAAAARHAARESSRDAARREMTTAVQTVGGAAGQKRRTAEYEAAADEGGCPRGHAMRWRTAPTDEGWCCDGCGEGLVPGCAIRCCEPCDYDLCQACAEGGGSAAARRAARRTARGTGRG